jgi:hypothetical protein
MLELSGGGSMATGKASSIEVGMGRKSSNSGATSFEPNAARVGLKVAEHSRGWQSRAVDVMFTRLTAKSEGKMRSGPQDGDVKLTSGPSPKREVGWRVGR